jgi:hypothetical protein
MERYKIREDQPKIDESNEQKTLDELKDRELNIKTKELELSRREKEIVVEEANLERKAKELNTMVKEMTAGVKVKHTSSLNDSIGQVLQSMSNKPDEEEENIESFTERFKKKMVEFSEEMNTADQRDVIYEKLRQVSQTEIKEAAE